MSTLLAYIHALAEETQEFGVFATTAAGASDGSTLICSNFENANLESSENEDTAVLLESGAYAGQQRYIRRGGTTKTTGTLTFADEFPGPVASGVDFSTYSRMPAHRRLTTPGLREIINQALKRDWVEDEISISGVTNQIHYTVDQTTYPWWTDDRRIIGIYRPVTNADYVPEMLPYTSWEWRGDGETRRLAFPYAPWKTGESFVVKLYRPANSRLKLNATAYAVLSGTTVGSIVVTAAGYYTVAPTVTISGGGGTGATATATLTNGAVTSIAVTAPGSGFTSTPTVSLTAADWSDQSSQTAGLVTLSDQALADIRDVVVVGQAYYYKALSTLHAPGQDVAEWLLKAQQWGGVASRLARSRVPANRMSGAPRLRPRMVALGRVG